MKKITDRQIRMDKLRSIAHRRGRAPFELSRIRAKFLTNWREINRWIDSLNPSEINISKGKKRKLTIHLPEVMNFSSHYEETVLCIITIRKLVNRGSLPMKAYKLASVNFSGLKSISTSAALVLTSELSRWDDSIKNNLIPKVHTWDKKIAAQFDALGFFNLFTMPPTAPIDPTLTELDLVKYIKGRCGESRKTRVLKNSLKQVIGDDIDKWTFLHSGLDEAITNVSHHAYPKNINVQEEDKNWYLTGSYNQQSKVLKIAFYDQGIGIPKSLPASEVWEKILKQISKVADTEKRLHRTLLKAAVQMDRTSTEQSDRGKGLQDLLTFVKQRKEGYLSLISLKGLYKYTMLNGTESDKTVSFKYALPGTLIIWSVTLSS